MASASRAMTSPEPTPAGAIFVERASSLGRRKRLLGTTGVHPQARDWSPLRAPTSMKGGGDVLTAPFHTPRHSGRHASLTSARCCFRLIAQLSRIAARVLFARSDQAACALGHCWFATIGAFCGPLATLSSSAGDLGEDRRRQSRLPRRRSRHHGAIELSTETIGARRAWTVSMISVLSMPWR